MGDEKSRGGVPFSGATGERILGGDPKDLEEGRVEEETRGGQRAERAGPRGHVRKPGDHPDPAPSGPKPH